MVEAVCRFCCLAQLTQGHNLVAVNIRGRMGSAEGLSWRMKTNVFAVAAAK